MPFISRIVTPKYVSREKSAKFRQIDHQHIDDDLEAIANITLSNALRQLASILSISDDIFSQLNKELETIHDRSSELKHRIDRISNVVERQCTNPDVCCKLFV